MADKITKPILLVHGEDDNNPGTFPLQSERFYQVGRVEARVGKGEQGGTWSGGREGGVGSAGTEKPLRRSAVQASWSPGCVCGPRAPLHMGCCTDVRLGNPYTVRGTVRAIIVPLLW